MVMLSDSQQNNVDKAQQQNNMENKEGDSSSPGLEAVSPPEKRGSQESGRPFTPVVYTQHQLYSRYSSSQHYFYSNKISEIIKQKCVSSNIMFEDIQCLLDEEEYLKRQYHVEQYPRKLATFKEYYFYHEDCPRIFGNLGVAQTYEKWHEKKRDYIYKKLKFMYNETYSSLNSSEKTIEEIGGNPANVTHFLLDISQYNPFSRKYYLRVEARQQKQRQELLKQKQKNQSLEMYHNLNSDLSKMLNKINNDLSGLTVTEADSQEKRQKHFTPHYSHELRNTSTKLNFKKKQAQQVHLNELGSERKSPEMRNKVANVETEESDNRKLTKHKKYISEINKNEYQLNSNYLLSQNKVKSILLMSSLTSRSKELDTNTKLKLLRFGDKNVEKRTPQVMENKRVEKNPAVTNHIRSYKSLEKLDRFAINSNQIKQQVKLSSQIKYSHSVSKLARISPTKQKNQAESLTKIIDKKLESRQNSLKKPGWETDHNNAEQFSDKRLVNKGLISYKSERMEPTSSSTTNFSLKQNNFGKKIFSQQKLNSGPADRKLDELPQQSEGRGNQASGKSGKKSIRISFKSSTNNFKFFNK